MQDGSAAAPHLILPAGQPDQEAVDPLLHQGLGWTLRISSGVSEGIYESVVQSGRDFPYIRVGGGQ